MSSFLIVIGLLVFILFEFLLFSFIKQNLPIWVGRSGERFVAKQLFTLDPDHYKVLNNLLLPSQGNTNYTQIDHVVISNYGVFCLETKDYEGWIFGNAYDAQWTQVIYKYRKQFYNPIRQNYVHIKALERLIQLYYHNHQIYSYIVFPRASKIQISGTSDVGFAGEILEKIRSHENIVFSDIERDKIYGLLEQFNNKDEKVIKEHVQEVSNLNNRY